MKHISIAKILDYAVTNRDHIKLKLNSVAFSPQANYEK
jgi:hypothetical protein